MLSINQQLQQLTKHLIKTLEAGGIETTDLIYYNNVKNDLLIKQRILKRDELYNE